MFSRPGEEEEFKSKVEPNPRLAWPGRLTNLLWQEVILLSPEISLGKLVFICLLLISLGICSQCHIPKQDWLKADRRKDIIITFTKNFSLLWSYLLPHYSMCIWRVMEREREREIGVISGSSMIRNLAISSPCQISAPPESFILALNKLPRSARSLSTHSEN